MKTTVPTTAPGLLLIDDDRIFGRSLARALAAQGLSVTWVRSCAEARAVVCQGIRLDYAVVDDRLGDGFGLELLPLLDALQPRPLAVLISAHVSTARAIAALRAQRMVLPKPKTPSELLELLAVLDEHAVSSGDGARRTLLESEFGAFVLDAQGLRTPTGFVVLQRAPVAMLRFLLSRSERFLSAADIARDFLGRRDEAANALVRRQVANLRRSLGRYAWMVESVPKCGYRIHPRALGPQTRETSS